MVKVTYCFKFVSILLLIFLLGGCEKESYKHVALQIQEPIIKNLEIGGNRLVISQVDLVDPGRNFEPSFVAMSFDIQEKGVKSQSVSILIPESEKSRSFKLDVPALLDKYFNTGEIGEDYTTARNAFVVFKNLNTDVESVFVKSSRQRLNAQHTINRNETKQDSNSKYNCTCWYWDTHVNGILVESQFLGCNCACDDPTSAITCGNAGGGGGSKTVHLNNAPPDCESFPYEVNNSITNRISGAHMVYFHYNSYQWGSDFDFEYIHHRYTFDNILYFTAPLYMSNSESANLTAEAISAVNERLEAAFGHNGWGSNPSAVENFILQAMNEEMSIWGGKAGLQSNGASNSQIGVYNETWLPNTCN